MSVFSVFLFLLMICSLNVLAPALVPLASCCVCVCVSSAEFYFKQTGLGRSARLLHYSECIQVVEHFLIVRGKKDLWP